MFEEYRIEKKFKISSNYKPQGDQQQAIESLTDGLKKGFKFQTLLGVTGSGKTFTMANVIQEMQLPTLVLAPNKTLAAQLCNEFREFFPENAVEYFVSYYDYYQPEAYIPSRDMYIEKDSSINEEIEKLRLSTTNSLFTRKDVVVVSSVSCIYNLGSPEEYENKRIFLKVGEEYSREQLIKNLVSVKYERSDYDFTQGNIRVKGDVIEIFPAYQDYAIRVQFYGDEIEKIIEFDPVSGEISSFRGLAVISPATHFLASSEWIPRAIKTISKELEERVYFFKKQGKIVEAQRLESRTKYDMEMIGTRSAWTWTTSIVSSAGGSGSSP